MPEDVQNTMKFKETLSRRSRNLKHGRGVPVVTGPLKVNVKEIRESLGLTQEEFAQFGFSIAAVRHWEQGLRRPSGAAQLLLALIKDDPDAVLRTLAKL